MQKLLTIGFMVLLGSGFGCGRQDSGSALTDTGLQKKIEAALSADSELGAATLSINADAKRNSAVISGTVDSEALRQKAVDLVRSAHPGLTVEGTIGVKPGQISRAEYTAEHARREREKAKERKDRIGTSIDDAWIHTTILARLAADANEQGHPINIDVSKGVVTLRGSVNDANHKSGLERIAKQTAGVKRVHNLLKVPKNKPA